MARAALRQPGKVLSTMLQLHPTLPAMHVVKVAGTSAGGELVFGGSPIFPNDPMTDAGAGAERQLGQIGDSADG